MRNQLICFALCGVVLTGTASAGVWPSWAEPAEIWAEQKQLSTTFLEQPLTTVTRGQAAQMFYEAAGRPQTFGEVRYRDVPEAYADAITWAATKGIVQGVGNNLYLPERPVTRQEFAVMLYHAAGSPQADRYNLDGFSDANSLSEWAKDAMRWSVGMGFMTGKPQSRLAPQDIILVAEAVAMLQRAETGSGADKTVAVSSLDDIKTRLLQAMVDVKQPPVLDIHKMEHTANLEFDVRNIYNAILSERPELKYAYDFQVRYTDTGLLYGTFFYMPYRTGQYPTGFEGVEVSSLQDLIKAARINIQAQKDTPIQIINTNLTVDDMNKALQQVGGGYIICQLNPDGTKITFSPSNNMTYTDSLSRLREVDTLAEQVVAIEVNNSMSDYQKAEALYTYLTQSVRYDHRYYIDRTNMPYDSQTAYGALQNQLAICGGYAQALQILFEKVGIPCYTVSGSMGKEYHMWNIAYLDGEWRYFDATSDRGRADYWFNYFAVTADLLTTYTWDRNWVNRLIARNV